MRAKRARQPSLNPPTKPHFHGDEHTQKKLTMRTICCDLLTYSYLCLFSLYVFRHIQWLAEGMACGIEGVFAFEIGAAWVFSFVCCLSFSMSNVSSRRLVIE